ncbi:MAG: calcium/sodium antiporter [Paracoccaceae bacterium]
MDFVYAALGLVILVLAGDVLVRGAVNVSLRLGVPALIVSLTIVAIGTSAPELLIAIKAVLEDAPGIAVGNVVGSNIANVLLVLGLPALIAGIGMSDCDSRHSYMQMLAGTALFAAVAFMAPITWLHGVILLTFYSVFIGNAMFSGRRHRKANNNHDAALHEIEGADEGLAWWKITLFLVLGLIGLPWGADILVNSATIIARTYDVSETAIGLTLVAVGTSLPELATTVSAALRRQTAVIMGNVIGSNMANLLAIIGISAFFGDIPVAPEILRFDLWIMVAAALLIAPFILGKVRIGRIWGAGFLALYVVYIYLVLG